MKSVPSKITFLATQHAHAGVLTQFAGMLNPKYRGPSFDWHHFVSFAVRWVEVTCWQPFSDREWTLYEKEIKEIARNTAQQAAQRALEESDLLAWWPDPSRRP